MLILISSLALIHRSAHSWISSAQVAQRGVLIARTNPNPESGKAADGLSLFFARLREEDGSLRKGIEMRRIAKMGGRAVDANEVNTLFRFYATRPLLASLLLDDGVIHMIDAL